MSLKNVLRRPFILLAAPALLVLPSDAAAPSKARTGQDLKIISIDVEGGSAVLFKTPDGKSLLIDTGWAPGGGNARPLPTTPPAPAPPTSADRIAAAAKALGITKIDYLVMTHYHADHLGGLDALLAKLPVDTFVDHGPNREFPPPNASDRQRANSTEVGYQQHWLPALQGHNHIVAITGQTLDVGKMHIQFVSSDGVLPDHPLPGAGQPNPNCAGVPQATNDGGEENVRSVGMLITYGKTRILYLGDLTWNKEIEMLCPVNRIGKVDVYWVTGHGMNLSSSPPTAAFDPLVAIMQNGPRKGGDEAVIKTVTSYPSLQGYWRTHYSVRYPDLNGDPNYIANPDWYPDQNYWIQLSITSAGKITVMNSRNRFTKSYEARGAQ
jgi:competence protein ComEC